VQDRKKKISEKINKLNLLILMLVYDSIHNIRKVIDRVTGDMSKNTVGLPSICPNHSVAGMLESCGLQECWAGGDGGLGEENENENENENEDEQNGINGDGNETGQNDGNGTGQNDGGNASLRALLGGSSAPANGGEPEALRHLRESLAVAAGVKEDSGSGNSKGSDEQQSLSTFIMGGTATGGFLGSAPEQSKSLLSGNAVNNLVGYYLLSFRLFYLLGSLEVQ
jgi:hypothetical protein